MTVVVTGAAGHLGGNLVRALLGQGRSVRALVHRDRRALAGLPAELVQADLDDTGALTRAFAGAGTVYHSAAQISLLMSDWRLVERVNVEGTRHVIEACRRAGVKKLIHFSSIHAFRQQPLEESLDEGRSLVGAREGAPYDWSKAAGERLVREAAASGLETVILNPTAIIGPHDYRPSHIGEVIAALARGTLPALVPGGFDWVDVRDVVAGALSAEAMAPAGARYLLSGHWAPLPVLAGMLAELTGIPPPRFLCPMALAYGAAPFATAWAGFTGRRALYTRVSLKDLWRSNRRISHELASRELGYDPRPLAETIADTWRWMEQYRRQ